MIKKTTYIKLNKITEKERKNLNKTILQKAINRTHTPQLHKNIDYITVSGVKALFLAVCSKTV